MRAAILLVAALACGCGPRAARGHRAVTAPDGGRAYTFECETTAQCYERAGNVCPKGYEVIDTGVVEKPPNPVATVLAGAGSGASRQPYTPPPPALVTELVVRCTSGRQVAERDYSAPPASACPPESWYGTFEVAPTEKAGGTCGLMRPFAMTLIPSAPMENCILSDEWLESGCSLFRRRECQIGDAKVAWIFGFALTDSWTIVGTMRAEVQSADPCSSDYALSIAKVGK